MKKLFIIILATIPLFLVLAGDFPSIKGWEKAGEVKTYYADNLWEYINGAAENFLSYGFVELNYCDMQKGDLIVTVNIYDMGNALNAFGIYTSEKGTDQETLDIGVESILSLPYQCLQLKGQYYIKIDAFEGKLTKEKTEALLTAVSEALPGSNEVPGELAMLPSENKIEGSENFIRENFLGLEILKNSVFAEYKEGKNKYKVFKVILDKGAEKKYFDTLKDKWDSKKYKNMDILYRQVPYSGYVGVSFIDNTITGIAGIEKEKDLFKKIYNLKKSEKK
ncbi:MAG: DUF6599 family protein [bacterium]